MWWLRNRIGFVIVLAARVLCYGAMTLVLYELVQRLINP